MMINTSINKRVVITEQVDLAETLIKMSEETDLVSCSV